MRKINDTMNRLAVAAYVKGGRMRKKLAAADREKRTVYHAVRACHDLIRVGRDDCPYHE